jgi:hypothetical protein
LIEILLFREEPSLSIVGSHNVSLAFFQRAQDIKVVAVCAGNVTNGLLPRPFFEQLRGHLNNALF